MKDALREADRALQKEMEKQVDMIYSAMAIAFKRYWGWGALRIRRLMDKTQETWDECGSTNEVSMLEMLENETGIEIRNHELGKSWHDLAYLNAKIDMGRMNRAQWIYMRQRQKEWVGPQVVACVLLSLYRKYGFGHVRCLRVLQQIEEVEREFNFDVRELRTACMEEAGVELKGGGSACRTKN